MPRHSKVMPPQFVKVCECGCGEPTRLASYSVKSWGWVKGQPVRFVKGHQSRGRFNNWWNGAERRMHRNGYIWVRRPDHPAARGGFVQEHRLVVEARLGRYLTSDEIVHHADENPSNNADSNLILTSRPDHARIHHAAPGWSRKHDRCVECGTTKRRHEAHGLCPNCYQRRKRSA